MCSPKYEETRALVEYQKSFLDRRTLELHDPLDMDGWMLDRVTYLYNRSALLTDLAARAYNEAPSSSRKNVIYEVQELVDKLDHPGAEFTYGRWTARYTDAPFPRMTEIPEEKGSFQLVKQVFDIPVVHWIKYQPHGLSGWRLIGNTPEPYHEESIGQPWPQEYSVAFLTGSTIPDTGLSYSSISNDRSRPHVHAPDGSVINGPIIVAGLYEEDSFRHDFDLRVAERIGLWLRDIPFAPGEIIASTHDRYPDDIPLEVAVPGVAFL